MKIENQRKTSLQKEITAHSAKKASKIDMEI